MRGVITEIDPFIFFNSPRSLFYGAALVIGIVLTLGDVKIINKKSEIAVQ